MKFTINDLVFEYQLKTEYEVIYKIKEFINLLIELKKRKLLETIYYDKSFRGIELAPGYFFEKMLNDKRLTRDESTYIKTYLTKATRILTNENQKVEIDGKYSLLLPYAYFNSTFLLSIKTTDIYDKIYINGTLHNDKEKIEISLPNLLSADDIGTHKECLGIRIYEENPKHKVNYGWGSQMDLDEEKAQHVLDAAIYVPGNSGHLINYYNGKYYSFRRHHENCFHGYIDEGLPERLRKLLTKVEN